MVSLGWKPGQMSLVSALPRVGGPPEHARETGSRPSCFAPTLSRSSPSPLVFGSLSTNLPGSSVPQGSDDHTWIIQRDTPV